MSAIKVAKSKKLLTLPEKKPAGVIHNRFLGRYWENFFACLTFLKISCMVLPDLLHVPFNKDDNDLKVKLSTSGITILSSGRYRKRYTGSKYHAIDINGKLWLRASDLKKEIDKGSLDKPKKMPRLPERSKKLTEMSSKDINKILTEKDELSTEGVGLSPKKERLYTIHKREVRGRVLAMINSKAGKKELYFWTVTFPEGISDDLAYQVYNIWLTSLRRYKLLKNYLWVAERQKNGTVHFHICIPHKMPVKKANAMMAGTLKTFARRGQLPFTVHQCKRYNGVDIAKNRNTKRVTNFAIKKGRRSLVTYLTKYIAKNDGSFSHLAWHNSRGFSALFTGLCCSQGEIESMEREFLYTKNRELFLFEKAFHCEWFTFIPWASDPPEKFLKHLDGLNSYLQDITAKN